MRTMRKWVLEKASVLVIGLLLGIVVWGLYTASQPTPCSLAAGECPVGSTSIFSNTVGIQGGTAFTITLDTTPTEARTITFPDDTSEVVLTSTAQTLTNKTLTSPVLTTPQLNDTSADHQYITAVSELAADRTVTWPLLAGNDTLVFQDHIQTLTNKSIVASQITAGTFAAGTFSFSGSTLTTLGIVSSLGTVNGGTINAGLTWSAAQNLNSQALTNVNIDSGDISAATISGGLTWSAAQNLNSQALTNADINSGSVDGATIGAASASTIVGTTIDATTDFTVGTTVITSGQLQASSGDLTLDTVGGATDIHFSPVRDNVFDGRVVMGANLDIVFPGGTSGVINLSSAGTIANVGNAGNDWTAGILSHVGYIQLTEMAAPGAGAANTARIYAVVDGGTLTDLAAVFQDGTVDIFAQEATEPGDAVVAAPDNAGGSLTIRRPHPGVVQAVIVVPGYGDWVIAEKQFHDAEKISWVQGARDVLPMGWTVETKAQRRERTCIEQSGTWDSGTQTCAIPQDDLR